MKRDIEWLQARARIAKDKLAVVDGVTQEGWTYGELNERVTALALGLKQRGVTQGDRVALLAPNHIVYLDLIFACRRIGAIFVPLNWRLSTYELEAIYQDCAPNLLIYHSSFEQTAAQLTANKICLEGEEYTQLVNLEAYGKLVEASLVQFNMDHPWMIIYTGGTTGKPKGVVLTNRAVYTNSVNTILSWNLSANDTTLTVLPMFHTGGINALTLPILHMGGKVILYPEFNREKVQDLIQQYRCTIVLMVPTMYHEIILSDSFKERSFPSMQVFLSGGAPCPPTIYKAFEEKGVPFREGYGLTEAGPNNFFITPENALKKKGSVGRPMLYNAIKVLDERYQEVKPGEVGELAISGEHLFDSYWNNAEETAKVMYDGWLLTGDLVRKDDFGDFYIMGRKKDMIITGGENVYPQEIEQVLCEHQAIKEIVIIGLPDQKWGEVVAAVVTLHPGYTLDEGEFQAYCSKKLARYKVPKQIYFTNEIPKTHVGKIDKQHLIQRYKTGS